MVLRRFADRARGRRNRDGASHRSPRGGLRAPAESERHPCRHTLGRKSPNPGRRLRTLGNHGCRAPVRAVGRTRARDAAGRRFCPSVSCRFRIAPALTSAGAETTRPFGWMKPSHSRWARCWGRGRACGGKRSIRVQERGRDSSCRRSFLCAGRKSLRSLVV